MKYKILLLLVCFSTMLFAQNTIISEDLMLKNDSIILPGTLTYNKELKKQPLVIFIHGSGNVDRNGNQIGLSNANYIKQLSDSLVKRDMAFYRYDKRSANWVNLRFMMKELTFDKFVDDAKIVINHFKNDERFSSITLIGHSQGSLVSMLASSEDVDKYISLAGPGERVDIMVVNQLKAQNDTLSIKAKAHFKELSETGDIQTVDSDLATIFAKPNLPFFKSWMSYEPTNEIKNLQIPILIINGLKDSQVLEKDAQLLHEASPKSELVLIPNMNHVLKTIEQDSDNEKSYTSPDFPLSQELITTLEAFIKK